MKNFSLNVTLVSELIDYSSEGSNLFSDGEEAFNFNFYNFGGIELPYEASPYLKDELEDVPAEHSFIGLDWDEENGIFEGSFPSYEIKSIDGDQDSGWDYEYRLLVTFTAQTVAANLEEARAKLTEEASELFDIYDGGVDEVIGVAEIRVEPAL